MSSEAKKRVFIIGGTRSGKSAYALKLATEAPGKKTYIATAQALDPEMAERIKRHKAERPGEWATVEEPVELARALYAVDGGTVIIDCLTLWISNLMAEGLDDRAILKMAEGLAKSIETSRAGVVTVSNEVGLGIVPDNSEARRFRDLSGMVNQIMAASASEVFFIASGLALKMK